MTERTVLITGASSGIGRATAREFRSRGWAVFGTARAPQGIRDDDRIDGVAYLPLDFHDPATIEAMTKKVSSVDVLINNAGIGQAGAVEDVSVVADRKLFQTNVFGPLELTRAYLPAMRAANRGTIIFSGSLIAEFPVPFQSGYAASKLALSGYVQALRHELGPYGIRTVLVQPGYIRTGIAQKRVWIAPPESPYFNRSTTVQRRVDLEHDRAVDPSILARHLLRLSEHSGPLPPRTTVGVQAATLTVAKRFLSGYRIEKIIARRFGLTGASPS
jgi:NAD(P)-dependent dehydrogenase (short-subunit alcohol dehydrogenase family)